MPAIKGRRQKGQFENGNKPGHVPQYKITYELVDQICDLRSIGLRKIVEISSILRIPNSTLDQWLSDIKDETKINKNPVIKRLSEKWPIAEAHLKTVSLRSGLQTLTSKNDQTKLNAVKYYLNNISPDEWSERSVNINKNLNLPAENLLDEILTAADEKRKTTKTS